MAGAVRQYYPRELAHAELHQDVTVRVDTQLDPGEGYYKTRYGGITFSHTKPEMIDPVCTVGMDRARTREVASAAPNGVTGNPLV